MAFEQSLETRLARSASDLVVADADFSDYYAWGSGHRVYVIGPTVELELIRIPTMTIQPMPDRDILFRLIGQNLQTTANLRFTMYEIPEITPVSETSITLVDRLQRLEEILFGGYDDVNPGKMVDPDNADSVVPSVKYLTRRLAGVFRLGVRQVDLSARDDQSTIALAAELVASWEMFSNPTTGKRLGES